MDKDFKSIEKYAEEHNIPIMEKTGIKFLTKYIEENNVKSILEIGSAIGYSAIKMALVNENIKITTIGYKNYLYNAYQSAIRNYNHSLTDNDLVSTEGQNQLLHDCYYEVKEGSPYCPSKGCKEDEYDLGSVRIV